MEARLPLDKVERIQASLASFKSRKSCTLKELQSLIGTLNFACKVVHPGRPFPGTQFLFEDHTHKREKEWDCRLPFSLSDGEILVSSTTCQANSVSSTIHTPGDLNNDISYYLGLSIAASTKQTYSSAEKRFLEFCLLYRPPFGKFIPVDENTLVQYAAYFARSINDLLYQELAAVRHLHIRNGYDLDFKKYPRLQLICKGITRAQGCPTRIRLPIIIHHLKLFFYLLAIPDTSNYDSLMIWAAMTLAFFGFMRLGELTCNSKFSFETHLSPSDVRFLPSLSQPDYLMCLFKWRFRRLTHFGLAIPY